MLDSGCDSMEFLRLFKFWDWKTVLNELNEFGKVVALVPVHWVRFHSVVHFPECIYYCSQGLRLSIRVSGEADSLPFMQFWDCLLNHQSYFQTTESRSLWKRRTIRPFRWFQGSRGGRALIGWFQYRQNVNIVLHSKFETSQVNLFCTFAGRDIAAAATPIQNHLKFAEQSPRK
jgi:hypothetical protein